jgi:hypothetical protein
MARAQVVVQTQGTQGPPGVRWRGDYVSTEQYAVRDLVRDPDTNIIYIVVAEIAANSNYLLSNLGYFNVFQMQSARAAGMQWRGDYDASLDYDAKDLVRDPTNNYVYYLKTAVARNSNPDFTNTDIADLVLRGLTVTDEDIASLNTLSPFSSYLQTVAGVATEVGAVGAITANVTSVANNETNVNTVANNIANVSAVGGDITNVNTVASSINTSSSALNTALANASAAEISELNAATSATNAATSEANAATSATSADTKYQDANKLVSNPLNTQFTLSDGSTGYSATHFHSLTSTLAADVADKFIGSYTTSTLPTTNLNVGTLAYDTDVSKVKVWDGTQWLVGLEGPTGATGPGITNVTYDSVNDVLTIETSNPGVAQVEDPRIGSQDIDFGQSQIFYSNNVTTTGNLPSATDYPGAFFVANGIPHFSHNGKWYEMSYNPVHVLSN